MKTIGGKSSKRTTLKTERRRSVGQISRTIHFEAFRLFRPKFVLQNHRGHNGADEQCHQFRIDFEVNFECQPHRSTSVHAIACQYMVHWLIQNTVRCHNHFLVDSVNAFSFMVKEFDQ